MVREVYSDHWSWPIKQAFWKFCLIKPDDSLSAKKQSYVLISIPTFNFLVLPQRAVFLHLVWFLRQLRSDVLKCAEIVYLKKLLLLQIYFWYNWFKNRKIKLRNKYVLVDPKCSLGKEKDLYSSMWMFKCIATSLDLLYTCSLTLSQTEPGGFVLWVVVSSDRIFAVSC